MDGSWNVCFLALLAGLCLYTTNGYDWTTTTPLDEYVQGDDGYFSWQLINQVEYDGVTVYVVNMTSQKYQDESFVSRSVWWHFVGVAIPHNIRLPDYGFLAIEGGDNDEAVVPDASDISNILVSKMANETGMIGGYVQFVPNQPVVFSNDPTQRSRSEDRIIAWTWRTYIDAAVPDPTVILRMPMTKAAKRGLDTIHEVAKAMLPATHLDKFIVSGASKRGWTTWSLACTDQRVVALIPMVFSMLNIPPTLQNHFRDMNGAWSFAFEPYWAENLTQEMFNPKTDGVWDVEDMYRYRERLAGIPKLLMSSSGDEFFLLDDTLQWWNDMPEPKWLMMLPNAEHVMAPHYLKIYETVEAFITSILANIPLPTVTWTMQETTDGGLIVISTVPRPYNITGWSATTSANDTRRDYRLMELDENGEEIPHRIRWEPDVEVVDFGDGVQSGAATAKVDGEWVGFFIQCIFEGPPPNYHRLYLTTQVNIIPWTFPRGPCVDAADCYGKLV